MSVVIDCDSCQMRDLRCGDCVVTVLLGPPPAHGVGEEEARALDVLAAAGLVPGLRMVSPVASREVHDHPHGPPPPRHASG